ncbi:ATP-binding protein [Streptomyces sp. MBT67]|uniref:ATP-binding protein n=1 Tax=Streptomyces sp. MBT67 TaxID=1488397 RepID=UPI00190C2C7D|nr:ATP-binding protein [Streptomyces sp. MBT67]MBK3540249.1 ATP-binding protein [Streptomyces sp. MBT67]
MSQSSPEDKTPAREIISEYALDHFEYFRTPSGTAYALRKGSPVARPLRSQGTAGSHRQELMLDMYHEGMGIFSGTAMKESLDFIEALTLARDVRDVYIRVGPCKKTEGVTWLDLGRDDGLSVRISTEGWVVRKPAYDEMIWRRTQLVGELPMPEVGQDMKGIDRLWELCNFVDAGSSTLALVWLLACLDPDVPVPAAFLTGPMGAGKSTAGRMLTRVIEGMSADLRTPPRGEEQLTVVASAGWIMPLDNLSHLGAEMSDAYARVVTGSEDLKRQLFSDGDVVRLAVRRPVLITGIDVGVIRSDLGERLLLLKLERPQNRRSERDLWTEYAEALPSILGSLLDLVVTVRKQETEVPADLRMADFGQLCLQLDKAHSLGAMLAYRASIDDITDDVIEGDNLAQLVLRYAASEAMEQAGGEMKMSSTEWLALLNRFAFGDFQTPPKGWPTTGKVLSDRLKRLQPTLAARGVKIESGRRSRHEDPNRSRYVEISRMGGASIPEQARAASEQTEFPAATR